MNISSIAHTHLGVLPDSGKTSLLNRSLTDSMNDSAQAVKDSLNIEQQKPTSLIENMIENNRRDMEANAERAKKTDLYV